MKTGPLNRRLTIQRPVADDSFAGAGSGSWANVALKVPAGIEDKLPARGEQLTNGVNVATRSAHVWMRYRTDVTPDMRFVLGSRIMMIVSGPAEIGRREGLEFMVEDYSTPGNPA